MGRPPLAPRLTLHLLTAFTLIAILLIVFFPTLSYTKSIYHAPDDTAQIITDAFPESTGSPNLWLKQQQQLADNYVYQDTAGARDTIDAPTKLSALNIVNSIFGV